MANEGLGWDSLLKMVHVILVVTIASWVGGPDLMFNDQIQTGGPPAQMLPHPQGRSNT